MDGYHDIGSKEPPAIVRTTDARARTLCDEASKVDGGYMLALFGSLEMTSMFERFVFQPSSSFGVRLMGPGFAGLAWGATVGGFHLALPKCTSAHLGIGALEGTERSSLPLALTMATLAGLTAPLVLSEFTSADLQNTWRVEQRSARYIVSGISGFVGALIPYLIPPKTYRAMKELEGLSFGTDGVGVSAGYHFTF